MSKFAILRNENIVQHIIMVGERLNYKDPKAVDLVFDTEKNAAEVAKILGGKVIEYDEAA